MKKWGIIANIGKWEYDKKGHMIIHCEIKDSHFVKDSNDYQSLWNEFMTTFSKTTYNPDGTWIGYNFNKRVQIKKHLALYNRG